MENGTGFILAMKVHNLIKTISESLLAFGYKKAGRNWIKDTDEIRRIINLQKSRFGNQYYLNYDYILRKVPLQGMRSHFGNRFVFDDGSLNIRMRLLLDLDSAIEDTEREYELHKLILKFMTEHIENITSEREFHSMLKEWQPQSMIPGVTKIYFNMLNNDNIKQENGDKSNTIIRKYESK